jgi:hypothetical protein
MYTLAAHWDETELRQILPEKRLTMTIRPPIHLDDVDSTIPIFFIPVSAMLDSNTALGFFHLPPCILISSDLY